MKITKRIVWTGSYRGITFEINNLKADYEISTLYLYLVIAAIPVESKPESFLIGNFEYSKHPILREIDFHGGITWYSKEFDNKVIRVGCDYNHYWDEGKIYYADELVDDAKIAIDSVRKLIPGYKYHCSTVGGHWSADEGIFYGGKDERDDVDGKFISFKGMEWRKNNGWEPVPSKR